MIGCGIHGGLGLIIEVVVAVLAGTVLVSVLLAGVRVVPLLLLVAFVALAVAWI